MVGKVDLGAFGGKSQKKIKLACDQVQLLEKRCDLQGQSIISKTLLGLGTCLRAPGRCCLSPRLLSNKLPNLQSIKLGTLEN